MDLTQNAYLYAPEFYPINSSISLAPQSALISGCEHCGKAFTNTFKLKRHVNAVHLKLSFECRYCGKRYSQKDYRDRHIRTKHLSEMETEQKRVLGVGFRAGPRDHFM